MPNPTVLLKKRCSKPGQYFPRHPSSVPLPRPALARIPGGKLFFPCVGRLLKRGLFAADSKQRILVILVTCSKLFASHFDALPSIRSFNNFEGCALRAAAGGRAVAVPYFAPPR